MVHEWTEDRARSLLLLALTLSTEGGAGFSLRERDITLVVVGVISIVLLFNLFGMMGAWLMGQPFHTGYWWMWIMMMGFWLLIVGGIVGLVLWLAGQGRPTAVGGNLGGQRPLDTLRERYARGEISREEFERMRHDLQD